MREVKGEDFQQEQNFDAVNKANKKHDYIAARHAYEDILKTEPNNEEALKKLEELNSQIIKTATRFWNKAKEKKTSENYLGALADYNLVIKYLPEDAEAIYQRGVVNILLDKQEQAWKDFSQAISLNSNHIDAYLARGDLYLKQNKNQHALADCTHLLSLDNNNIEALFKLGKVYYQMGEYRTSITYFNNVIGRDSDHESAHLERAKAYYKYGNIGRSIRDYRQFLTTNPNNVDAHYGLGLALYYEGKFEDAATEFAQVTQLKPQDGNGWYYSGLSHYRQSYLAESYLRQSYLKIASEHLSNAILRQTTFIADAYYYHGCSQQDVDPELAILAYKQAINLKYENQEDAHLRLGKSLCDMGRYAEAITNLEIVLKSNPKNADANFYIGMAYKESGKKMEAYKYYQNVKQSDPKSQLAKQASVIIKREMKADDIEILGTKTAAELNILRAIYDAWSEVKKHDRHRSDTHANIEKFVKWEAVARESVVQQHDGKTTSDNGAKDYLSEIQMAQCAIYEHLLTKKNFTQAGLEKLNSTINNLASAKKEWIKTSLPEKNFADKVSRAFTKSWREAFKDASKTADLYVDKEEKEEKSEKKR